MSNSLHILSKHLDDLKDVVDFCKKNFPKVKTFTLVGDLGAGKTTFVQAFVESLGSEDDVTSPTFSLVNEYQLTSGTAYHMDLYRIESIEELLDIGFEDYLMEKPYLFIEWPTLALPLLDNYVSISIELLENNERRFNFTYIDHF